MVDHRQDGDAVRGLPTRRAFLVGAGAVAAGALGYPLLRRLWRRPEPVFLATGQRYDGPLAQTVLAGLRAVGLDPAWVRGRRVFLKPNLVEPTRSVPHMTTHPSLIQATAEVFVRLGAEVIVGEGPGHVRDTEMALIESGVEHVLRSERLRFVDINYCRAREVANAGGVCKLERFSFPEELLDADLVVSMPKLKTHHWVGMTASLKNLYGTLPGSVYGWPKNVLHYAGVPQTVVDIAACVPRTIAVVDGIECMEGDGPIRGEPKRVGVVAVGLNPTAVDATCARIMGLDPYRVSYLSLANGRLGPLSESDILQRGDDWRVPASPFRVIDVPHLRRLQVTPNVMPPGRSHG